MPLLCPSAELLFLRKTNSELDKSYWNSNKHNLNEKKIQITLTGIHKKIIARARWKKKEKNIPSSAILLERLGVWNV